MLFKKGYKIIFIKDGHFDLNEFHLTPTKISLLSAFTLVPFILFYFIIGSFNSNSHKNKDVLIQSQSQKINELENDNKIKTDKLNNYEVSIEKKISKNKNDLKVLKNELNNNQKRSDKLVKTLFKIDGLPRETRKAGSGGELESDKNKEFDNSGIEKLHNKSKLVSHEIKQLNKQINIEKIYLSNIEDKFYNNIKYWSSIPSRMPLDIKRGIYISSYYGFREDPINKRRHFHSGDDFSADIGTPVVATANGVVLKAGFDHRLGNFVEIDHGYGYRTVYGHMQDGLYATKGQQITRGQVIGRVGNTGRSTAAHLHYEVKHDNKTENPRKFYTYDKKLEQLIYFP